MQSKVMSSYFLDSSCGYLFRICPYELGCLRGWYRVKALLGLGVPRRAYLNTLIPEPSFHCGCWTLIQCGPYLGLVRCYVRIIPCVCIEFRKDIDLLWDTYIVSKGHPRYYAVTKCKYYAILGNTMID